MRTLKILTAMGALATLAACQTAEPTARNANGTLALSGPYVYHPSTGSFSRDWISSQEPAIGIQPQGAASVSSGGGV